MAYPIVRSSTIIESVLRVPPFFFVDEVLKYSLEDLKNGSILLDTQIADGDLTARSFSIIFSVWGFMTTSICCFLTLLTVTLNKKELITIYSNFISVFLLYFSYQRNVIFLNYLLVTDDPAAFYVIGVALVQSFLIQSCLSFAYQYLNPVVLKNNWLSKMALIGFLSSSVFALMPFPRWFLEITPFSSLVLLLTISTYIFWSNSLATSQSIVHGWRICRRLIVEFGLPALNIVLVKWSKLHLTAALRIFWIIRLLNHTIKYVVENDSSENGSILSLTFVIQMVKSLLSSGCETYMAVVGMASCVSYIFLQISNLFQIILFVDNRRKYFGMLIGPLFCTLALQTGLTNLVPEKRIVWLTRTFLLLFSLTLHLIHKILNTTLVSLSALRKVILHRHIRALLVSAFLISYPAGLLVYLWRNNSIGTWLLGFSAFNLKIIVKTTISLTIYFMFIADFFRETFWENLDDYVYYIDSFGSTIEFCFGIFLFLNGSWILFYESGSLIRAAILCLHAYFYIWFMVKAGWHSFMRRRTAVKKIDQLQDAKKSDLADLQDVCAICYQSMKAAKITLCKHLFHAICLRKWLYLQDYCPICRHKLYPHEEVQSQPS